MNASKAFRKLLPHPFRNPSWKMLLTAVGNGLGLSGIELGRLVEVVGEGFPGDLYWLSTGGADPPNGSGAAR
jgi:hypothetical protein